MIDYVSEDDVCRSAYLLEYFGQPESADCGTCDICRSGCSSRRGDSMRDSLVKFINEDMNGVYSLDDIKVKFTSLTTADRSVVLEQLRDLIDKGVVAPPAV